jgi:hypothetical protein
MRPDEIAAKLSRLAEVQAEAARLAAELESESLSEAAGEWARKGYYLTYYATAGFFLGMVAALVSLMFNIIGASVAGENPLQLIKVYLTFGLGGRALDPAFDSGLALAMGCVLYELATLHHAFDGNNLPALILKIIRGIYPPIDDRYALV